MGEIRLTDVESPRWMTDEHDVCGGPGTVVAGAAVGVLGTFVLIGAADDGIVAVAEPGATDGGGEADSARGVVDGTASAVVDDPATSEEETGDGVLPAFSVSPPHAPTTTENANTTAVRAPRAGLLRPILRFIRTGWHSRIVRPDHRSNRFVDRRADAAKLGFVE